MKKILSFIILGAVLTSGIAFAADDLQVGDFSLVMFGGEKFRTDPETQEKVSTGVVITSAGDTDLIYTGDALQEGQTSDVLAKLLVKVSVRELRPKVFEVQHAFAVSFLPTRWDVSGLSDHDEVEVTFEMGEKELADLSLIIPEKEQMVFQSSQLTAKTIKLFKKYGYANLTPEFQDLLNRKIHQFVWSIDLQLPAIVEKLIEKYPEIEKV